MQADVRSQTWNGTGRHPTWVQYLLAVAAACVFSWVSLTPLPGHVYGVYPTAGVVICLSVFAVLSRTGNPIAKFLPAATALAAIAYSVSENGPRFVSPVAPDLYLCFAVYLLLRKTEQAAPASKPKRRWTNADSTTLVTILFALELFEGAVRHRTVRAPEAAVCALMAVLQFAGIAFPSERRLFIRIVAGLTCLSSFVLVARSTGSATFEAVLMAEAAVFTLVVVAGGWRYDPSES